MYACSTLRTAERFAVAAPLVFALFLLLSGGLSAQTEETVEDAHQDKVERLSDGRGCSQRSNPEIPLKR